MVFNVAVIADIHFGAVKPDRLYVELKNEFLNFIEKRYIDMIVIAGDFYHSVVSLNSKVSMLSFIFMKELVELCKEKKIKYIRIIEGTLSHDNFQIKNFGMYENISEVDFKIITSVEKETLENGLKILYLPEEYMESPKEFYKPFIEVEEKYYDFIFGHGMFKETSFTKDEGENGISKAPIWDSSKLINICKGPIVFGHIHKSQIIKKQIYYTGSFSRWVYGQEEDKGFIIFSYADNKYAVEFIKNKLAEAYDTVVIHFNEYLNHNSLDSLIEYCEKTIINNLRIELLIDSYDRDFSYEISFLKEYYISKKNFKLDIIDKREKIRKEKIEEKVNQLLSEYDFLFKKEIPLERKVSKFIKRKYQREISEEMIKSILTKKEK